MVFNKDRRRWDLIAGVCLVLIVFISAYALELSYWTYDLNRVTTLALLGISSGILIGQSAFSTKFAKILLGLYTSALFLLQLVVSLSDHPSWIIRVSKYFDRVSSAISQLSRNIPLGDGILFLTGTGFLYLLTSMILGFRFVRSRSLWLPLLFLVGSYFLIQFYLPPSQRNYLFISFFSILLFLFVGRQYYLQKHTTWKKRGIREDKEVSSYLTKSIILITLCLVALSWGIPAISKILLKSKNDARVYNRQRYSTSWEIARNFFYPLRQQTGFGEGYFPEVLNLGTSRSLKDDEVFLVQINEEYSIPGRFYWKGRTFETYENGFWKNEVTELSDFRSYRLDSRNLQNIEPAVFVFTYQNPREVIFTPQVVIDMDRQSNILLSLHDGLMQEMIGVVDYGLVRAGESVEVLGGFNTVSLEKLKEENGNYPEWIIIKYLQLPNDFPVKIREISLEISAGKSSEIEKALEIINYLRNSFRYKDFVDIPQGSDPVEWFLFEGREGFCNYYASSAVLMLRSIGIPSRLVVGYAQGERINDDNNFMAKIKDSHSWIEAYFNDSGWITLEPTPSQPGVEFLNENQIDKGENIGRVESLFLQSPEEMPEENIGFFQDINEKYAFQTEESTDKRNGIRFLIEWIVVIALIFLILLATFYLVMIQQKPIQIPQKIIKAIKQKKNIPGWLNTWARYEELSSSERNYKRIKFLSNLILKNEAGNHTPREFFQNLFRLIEIPNSTNILENYQKIIYGSADPELKFIEANDYQFIIMLILKNWIDRNIKYIQFRLNLNRHI